MKIRLIAATTLALLATIAHAEPVTINPPPKLECKQPTMLGLQPSQNQVKAYNKSVGEYKKCVDAYTQARREAAESHASIAQQYAAANKAEVEAVNKAVAEYNDWVKQSQKALEE